MSAAPAPLTRSASIASILRDEILSGRFRPGERLPSERDLCDRFSVSRGAGKAIAGHKIMGYPIALTSVLGMIALAGVVVNSSLVMVDYVNRQRANGFAVTEAATRAGIAESGPAQLASCAR